MIVEDSERDLSMSSTKDFGPEFLSVGFFKNPFLTLLV